MAKIFGKEALPTVANLLFKSDDIAENIEKINTKGTLDRKADIMATSLNDAAARFKSAVSVARQNIFDALDDDGDTLKGGHIIKFLNKMSAKVKTFSEFVVANRLKIQGLFVGIKDTLTPIIQRVWTAIRNAYPDIKTFATEVWQELRSHWNAIAPIATAFANAVWALLRPVLVFVKEHPKLVATVLTGIAALKAYRFATNTVSIGYDLLAGGVSLIQGHYHKLNATVIGNQRALAAGGNVAASTGRKFLDMGKNLAMMKFPRFGGIVSGLGKIGASAIAAIPGIVAMGGSLWAAMIPILPVVIPVVLAIAALAGLGFVVYKNWSPIKAFFVDNWETIRMVISLVSPVIGIFIGLAGVIRDNWQPIKEMFVVIWETIRLSAMVAWEGIKFIALVYC